MYCKRCIGSLHVFYKMYFNIWSSARLLLLKYYTPGCMQRKGSIILTNKNNVVLWHRGSVTTMHTWYVAKYGLTQAWIYLRERRYTFPGSMFKLFPEILGKVRTHTGLQRENYVFNMERYNNISGKVWGILRNYENSWESSRKIPGKVPVLYSTNTPIQSVNLYFYHYKI